MALNEESVKAKLILPLLRSLGVTEDEIELETTISIQLGRGVYTIRGDESANASGRLDLLCRRNGQPLFIIELKSEAEEITDADRRQGLSYARLVEPMAPWVIISNGRHTRIYNTITGRPVDEQDKSLLGQYSPTLDSELALRFEALENFIGYSLTNLLSFCRIHNEEILAKFRADPIEKIDTQLQKKYLPSTYVPRADIENHFYKFSIEESAPVFAIVGESGTGKTSLTCHLLEKIAGTPALYYSGSLLGASLFREIALDFNLAFSPQDYPVAIARKVSALAERHGQKFFLLLDAIDEWEAPDKAQQLADLAKVCKRFHLKLVIACKKSVWPSFLSRNGIPTTLADTLYPNVPELLDFQGEELNSAIQKYSKLLTPPEEPNLAPSSLANPFALRMAFEVAYRDGIPLNASYDSRPTLSRYLDLKLGQQDSYQRRFLIAAGRLLLDLGQVQVSEEELRGALHLRLTDELPPALFEKNVLYRYTDSDAAVSIGFYFSLIRDYIVAINALRLSTLSGSKIIDGTRIALKNYVGQSALIYFLRTASEQEMRSYTEALLSLNEAETLKAIPLLLSWYGKPLKTLTPQQDRIFSILKTSLETNKDDLILAEQVVEVLNLWPPSKTLEALLVDLFDILSREPAGKAEIVSHKIADMLAHYRSSSSTKHLIALALDTDRDGYVRRYIVQCLASRTITNREEIFLRLIVDPDPNVRTFVRSWYLSLETTNLRDRLLQLFDSISNSNIKADIAGTLAHSRISGTGEQLFHRWQSDDFDDHLRSWTARSIATLRYNPAIPEFVSHFKEDPYSKVSEHLLLALGELRAKEVMPVLLNLIQEGDERLHPWWVLHAVRSIATTSDLRKIEKITRNPRTPYGRFLGVLALADTHIVSADQLIISFIEDKSVTESHRSEALHAWSEKILRRTAPTRTKQKHRHPLPSEEIILLLYKLLTEGSHLSSQALSLLMNVDNNVSRLADNIKTQLPRFRTEFMGHEIPYWHLESLEKLAPLIRSWLNSEIASPNLTSIHAANCLVLLDIFGDLSSLDALNANRGHLEELDQKWLLEHVEETLRRYGNRVRRGPRH